jgi:hypothetical protein
VHWNQIIGCPCANRYDHIAYCKNGLLYIAGGFDSSNLPLHSTYSTTNGIDWVDEGGANIHVSSRGWHAKLGNKIYFLNPSDGYVYESTDLVVWTRVLGNPAFYGSNLQALGIDEIGTIYILGHNTDPALGYISSLRSMQYTRKVLFNKDMTGIEPEEVITVSQVIEPSNGDIRPIVWLQNQGVKQITIQPPPAEGWVASGYLDDQYAVRYALGLNSQDEEWYNIDTRSIFINHSDIAVNSAEANFDHTAAWCYAVDSYSSPEEYGKVLLYSKESPTTPTTVEFNVYQPAIPTSIEITSSGSLLTYPVGECRTDENLQMRCIAPSSVTITASGLYEDLSLGIKQATIRLVLAEAQQNVLRLDSRFIDYFSYLRKA